LDNYYQNNQNQNNNSNPYYGVNGSPYAQGAGPEIKGVILREDVQTYVKWGKFLGIMIIITGALQCLTCIGAAWGIPMIIAGSKLQKSAQAMERTLLFGDELAVMEGFRDFSQYVKITGIINLVFLILGVVLFIVYIILALLAVVTLGPLGAM